MLVDATVHMHRNGIFDMYQLLKLASFNEIEYCLVVRYGQADLLRDVAVLTTGCRRIQQPRNSGQKKINPYSKVHGANMGPIWSRQEPGGPHVGPMNLAIWVKCTRRGSGANHSVF